MGKKERLMEKSYGNAWSFTGDDTPVRAFLYRRIFNFFTHRSSLNFPLNGSTITIQISCNSFYTVVFFQQQLNIVSLAFTEVLLFFFFSVFGIISLVHLYPPVIVVLIYCIDFGGSGEPLFFSHTGNTFYKVPC